MLAKRLLEALKPLLGCTITADITASTGVVSKPISLANFQKVLFLLLTKTAGTNTGNVTVTVEACSDNVATAVSAVDFSVYKNDSAGTSDDFGARVDCVAATGFDTTANKTAMYAIEVRADKLLASGYSFVRVKCTPKTVDTTLGAIVAIVGSGPEGDPDTLISVLS